MKSPLLYINRELSWLEFNARVLEEAQDPANPLLERVKFLSIFSSNLDEFFMVRVAGLHACELDVVPSDEAMDGMLTRDVLDAIARRAQILVTEQYRILRDEILPGLARHGIRILEVKDVAAPETAALDAYFKEKVMPVLTPMAIDPAHPFPHIQNRGLYIGALLKAKGRSQARLPEGFLAVLPIPSILPRLVPVSTGEGNDRFIFLEDLIGAHLTQIFSGFQVQEMTMFRVTRDQAIEVAEQEVEDLLKLIESELFKRKRGAAVRLEIGSQASENLTRALTAPFPLDPPDIYRIDGPLDLASLASVTALPGYAALRDEPYLSQPHRKFARHKGDIFSLIRQGDVLLHHPYESFSSVMEFVDQAAEDPDVLAIKQTLYRTGKNSPVVAALERAALHDKEVTALVELRARFEEEANIVQARKLERAGAHVVYGLVGLKTHCKATLVVRREGERIRRYVHLSTGNYNPATAKLYSDIGFMTCDEKTADDTAALFNLMTGYSQPPKWQRFAVAPNGLRERVIDLIEREATHKKAGRDARIIAKLNALVDGDVIQALYRASQAGVPIELIVRGICCLRPGVPDVSETIRVRSIVGRFLEHSRVLYFANGGQSEVFLSSADWMPRNFQRRVEILFPVDEKALKQRLIDEILAVTLLDDAKARVLRSDGTYARVGGTFVSQSMFQELARGTEKTFTLPASAPALKQT